MSRLFVNLERKLAESERTPEGCWIWPGPWSGSGRAYFGKTSASRHVYRKFKGDFDQSLYVLHSCDDPRCVNPEHLFLGSQQDNMDDMKNKGRQKKEGQPLGENHVMAKLTEQQARKIIALRKRGQNYREIADKFPVSVTQVKRIAKGQRWPHLQGAA